MLITVLLFTDSPLTGDAAMTKPAGIVVLKLSVSAPKRSGYFSIAFAPLQELGLEDLERYIALGP